MRRALAASATLLALVFGLLGSEPGAYAQGTTAAPVIPGYIATGSSCPTAVTPCFIQGSVTFTPLGYQQVTSLASSTALTVPTGATIALITVETANIRYRDDGTAPTTSVGMPLTAGQTFFYNGSLSAFRFIAVSGSPVVNVLYYK